MSFYTVVVFIVIVLINNEVCATEKVSRQKRCIVIQKQSGGGADSGEGSDDEDYDFKEKGPKDRRLDRLIDNSNTIKKKTETETVSPELLKYQKIPNRPLYRRLRTKNRLLRNNFDLKKLMER